LLDFSSNVNPFGPPPGVRAALAALDPAPYPDRSCLKLRRELAARYGCDMGQVLPAGRTCRKPLPPRVIAFVMQLYANPAAMMDEDLDWLQIRGTDSYSRICLPELLPLVEPAIVARA
jgi:hypothetical protein